MYGTNSNGGQAGSAFAYGGGPAQVPDTREEQSLLNDSKPAPFPTQQQTYATQPYPQETQQPYGEQSYPQSYGGAQSSAGYSGSNKDDYIGGQDNEDVPGISDFNHGTSIGTSAKAIKAGFIRKVYGILSVQLVITLGGIALCMYVESVNRFVKGNRGIFYSALFLPIVLICFLHCFRQKFPANIIILGLFTFCEAYTLGVVCAIMPNPQIVLQAVLITAVIFVSLTIFAFQTKIDFSFMGGALFCFLMVMVFGGLLQLFIPIEDGTFRFVWGILGALLFSLYILYDTSLLLHRLGPDEYILAAVNLYLDIINLFLYVLSILNSRS